MSDHPPIVEETDLVLARLAKIDLGSAQHAHNLLVETDVVDEVVKLANAQARLSRSCRQDLACLSRIRAERAKAERMKIVAADPTRPWTDYTVTSTMSGKTYRVALRGLETGISYCSCPDFRTNTLGTCKHLMKVAALARRKFTPRQLKQPYRRRRIAIHLRYDGEITLRLEAPPDLPEDAAAIVGPLLNQPIDDVTYDWGGNHHNDFITLPSDEGTLKLNHSSFGFGFRVCHPPDCVQLLDKEGGVADDGCGLERTRPAACVHIEDDGSEPPLPDPAAFERCPGDPNGP